ncbi:MAG: hypothetical protein ACYS47_04490 [Planctomycetota bacterium]|jgi:hypothetical protein
MSAPYKKLAWLGGFLAALFFVVGVTLSLSTVVEKGFVAVPRGGKAERAPRVRDEEAWIRETVEEDVRLEKERREIRQPTEEEIEEDPILGVLPNLFKGTYRWDDSDDPSEIVLVISELSVYDEATLVFSGTTDYDNGSLVVDINGDIDRRTLEIEFNESNPKGSAEIEGVFRGTITRDLKAIHARWVPFEASGRTGSLAVEAAEIPDPGAPERVSEIRRGRR